MWLIVVCLFVVWCRSIASDDLFCTRGDSDVGTAKWSWFLLGNRCTWGPSGDRIAEAHEPGVFSTFVAIILVAVGVAIVFWIVRDVRSRARAT